MAQVVKLKRSAVAGNVPESEDMIAGELAMNTADGKLFLRDTSNVRPIVTTDNEITGSINLIGNITASGDISASGTIVGSNLSGTNTGDQDLSSYSTIVQLNASSSALQTNIDTKVDTTGTPANNQIAIFTDSDTIEGDAALTFVGDTMTVDGGAILNNGGNDASALQAKGSSDNNLLQVNPQANDRVGIGTGTPGEKLEVIGNISASGHLFADVPENSDTSFKTVVYDTSTGKFHRTGSYSAGGGGAPSQGNDGTIQRSDGSGGFTGVFDDLYWNDTFRYFVIGKENPERGFWFGRQLQSDYITVSGVSSQLLSNNIATWNEGLVFSKGANFQQNYANFDGSSGHFILFPTHEIGNTSVPNTQAYMMGQGSPGELIGSARLHVVDDSSKGHAAKILNLDATEGGATPAGLLIGTKRGPTFGNDFTPAFPFIDFQVGCAVHQGTSIGGVYYDVYGTQIGGNANSATYVGQFVQGSDKKLKKGITNTKKGIKDIMSMKVKDYKWKSNPPESPKATGLIAQELQETHPELVSDLNDTLNVNYTNIVPILIKAVQDQQKQINDLKNQLKRNKK